MGGEGASFSHLRGRRLDIKGKCEKKSIVVLLFGHGLVRPGLYW